ncbi:hypothetical protein [Meiothermus granaticius]|uniref:Uncharacterized protein n=1 Tax=Meiothermus granaticius NBRC 107808 TaxID=1227551 RepID=A0A399FBC3_9DEIN|nr:hypothetical protein [Meiothermus granaticius]MCL6525395.1 hypothetical protein [Thermaceae bacterium]RIH92995.1 hypothetical protein Mgrana_01119 [Meiothermus granaticius NBRC 107808]GEM86167.1 hypothetical protein MGR01S_07920 [Meiothermus granaticius NBRC 107808]
MRLQRFPLLLLVLALGWAHPLSGNGPVSGEVKFEPDDQPIAGKTTVTYLTFVSINGVNLNLSDCYCRMLAYQGQASAQAKPDVQLTFSDTGKRLESKITFPKPGAYVVVVMGRALPGKNLPPFILTALIVVNPPAN